MSFRIERSLSANDMILQIVGRLQSQNVEELKAQIADARPRVIFDLEGVTLVDLDVVRFLGACETSGIEVIHCAP